MEMWLPILVGAFSFLLTELSKRAGVTGFTAQVVALILSIVGGLFIVFVDGGFKLPSDFGELLGALATAVPKVFMTAQLIYRAIYRPVTDSKPGPLPA